MISRVLRNWMVSNARQWGARTELVAKAREERAAKMQGAAPAESAALTDRNGPDTDPLVSPDGDQGYPGTLTATTRYRLTDDGYNITESLLTGGEARRPMLVPS